MPSHPVVQRVHLHERSVASEVEDEQVAFLHERVLLAEEVGPLAPSLQVLQVLLPIHPIILQSKDNAEKS